jgi:ABC-type lipoprotein export system ATPase subunit
MDNTEMAKSIKERALKIYTPSSPIDDIKFFQGRKNILKDIESNLSMPGKHVIIFGDRGVGKTSLLNVATKNKECLIYGCSSRDNLNTIFLDFLKRISAHRVEAKTTSTESSRGKAGINIKTVNVEKGREKTSETEYQVVGSQELTPHFVTSLFKDKEIILAMDEFERVEDAETKKFISEVIKKFSDANSKAKIIIVGIADSIASLLGEHESIVRNIQQIELDRLSKEEIIAIAKSGEEILGFTLEDTVIDMIIDYSDRFPLSRRGAI